METAIEEDSEAEVTSKDARKETSVTDQRVASIAVKKATLPEIAPNVFFFLT